MLFPIFPLFGMIFACPQMWIIICQAATSAWHISCSKDRKSGWRRVSRCCRYLELSQFTQTPPPSWWPGGHTDTGHILLWHIFMCDTNLLVKHLYMWPPTCEPWPGLAVMSGVLPLVPGSPWLLDNLCPCCRRPADTPRLLGCLHSVCSPCLNKVNNSQQPLYCKLTISTVYLLPNPFCKPMLSIW